MKKKINIRSNSGFTMADLVVALAVFTVFTGMIASLLYSAFKTDLELKLTSESINYAIQILEDIDKIPYDKVVNGMEDKYANKFLIPEGVDISIDVSNYNEGNSKKDLIKLVKVTISYEFNGATEKFVVNRLKIRES